jgi:hypothetical protein
VGDLHPDLRGGKPDPVFDNRDLLHPDSPALSAFEATRKRGALAGASDVARPSNRGELTHVDNHSNDRCDQAKSADVDLALAAASVDR